MIDSIMTIKVSNYYRNFYDSKIVVISYFYPAFCVSRIIINTGKDCFPRIITSTMSDKQVNSYFWSKEKTGIKLAAWLLDKIKIIKKLFEWRF